MSELEKEIWSVIDSKHVIVMHATYPEAQAVVAALDDISGCIVTDEAAKRMLEKSNINNGHQ